MVDQTSALEKAHTLKDYAEMDINTWKRCLTSTIAIEQRNGDCKATIYSSVTIINIYKMGKAICARFVVANLGHLVSYHDKSESKAPEHTAKRKQQRKCQYQIVTECTTPPNKQNDFVTTRKKYACVIH